MMALMSQHIPSWVQIPCNKTILDIWICKKIMDVANVTERLYSCPKYWFKINNKCVIFAQNNDSCYKKSGCFCDNHSKDMTLNLHNSYLYVNLKNIYLSYQSEILDHRYYNLTYDLCYKTVETMKNCHPGQFKCDDGSCISDIYVCDATVDCDDGTDENACYCTHQGTTVYNSTFCQFNCTVEMCECNHLFQQNKHTGCVVYYEPVAIGTSKKDVYFCDKNISIPVNHLDDMIEDCPNGIDEPIYKNVLNGKVFPHQCISSELLCSKGHTRCYPITQHCVYDLDEWGRLQSCTNGAHLVNCSHFPCSNANKCALSYCVPFRRVCDSVIDCLHGDDESDCKNFVCQGMLKCRTTSISQSNYRF